MVIDYPSQAFEPLARFKGGEKALNAKTFSDGTCRILRAYLEPGASIGMHEHAANCEVIYILSGSGTVVEDGGEKPVRAGQATYCERGRSHSLINTGAEDLHFFAVVPEVRQAGRMVEIQGRLVSLDVFGEPFCCDLHACRGACCVEGDAGAPVEPDEIPGLEEAAEALGGELTAEARAVIDGQGVAYVDRDGQLVTSIVDGKDCVFAVRDGRGCVLCAIDRARREGRTAVEKPLSCALYPVRLSKVGGVTALNYHRWDVCAGARAQGRQLALPVYRFLKAPLVRAFGQEWYDECELVATELRRQGYI